MEMIAMFSVKTRQRPGAGGLALAVWAAGLCVPGILAAQSAAAPSAAGAPSEAAARQALGPYRVILSNARPAAKAKPAVAPAAAVHAGRRKVQDGPPAALPLDAPTAPAAAAMADEPVAVAAPASQPAHGPAPAPLSTASAAAAPAAPATPTASAAPPPRPPIALVPLQQDPPVISGALMKEVPHGLVKLRFEVLPDGSTSAIQVASSTHRKLSAAATAAVAQWRFAPIDERRASEIEFVFSDE